MVNLFVDLDGVKFDFDGGFRSMFGQDWDDTRQTEMWSLVNSRDDFWSSLPLLSDAMHLWDFVKNHNPTFLTGCPSSGVDMADKGKRQAVLTHFGEIPVITCRSKDKQLHMIEKGDILIDDRHSNCKRWTKAGGISILHRSAKSTIKALNAHGL